MLADREQGVQARHRVLEHQAHSPTAETAQIGAAQAAGILAGEFQLPLAAAAGRQELKHGPGHGALAATRWTHQGQPLAGVEGQVEAIEGGALGAGVPHLELPQLQHRVVAPRERARDRKAGVRGGWRHGHGPDAAFWLVPA